TSAIETARIGESAQKGAALDDRKSYQTVRDLALDQLKMREITASSTGREVPYPERQLVRER
ncbi:hypothetical protein A4X13_0g9344, partial [Tilletia indica]